MSVITEQPPDWATPILDLIGNTPLVSFKRITQSLAPVEIFAKAEWYNPGGSVKDRAALSMILDGERRGLLTKDKIIIDATSGNTGIAYAMIAAERGYRVTLALPHNASEERKQSLRAYGAELILTDPHESTDGAQRHVKALVEANPGKYFYPDQYNNDANWKAHYHTTAMEIWRQTDGRITHFVDGHGHQRHVHGHHAPLEGIESRDPVHQHGPGCAAAWAGRHEAHADGARAGDL